MFKFFKNMFFPKTLDGAINHFVKAEQELQEVIAVRELDASEISLKINDLQIEHGWVLMEVAHAKRIQEKFQDLLK